MIEMKPTAAMKAAGGAGTAAAPGTPAAPDMPATPAVGATAKAERLISLDVFRGLVILAMLVVNNLGDWATTGYFWKHADWPEPWLGRAFEQWWAGLRSGALSLHAAFTQFPVFRQCTLADYVMPGFMLIIGLAIPYSVAASRRRGMSARSMWLRTLRRAAMLVLLGWVLCYFRDQFAPELYGERRFAVSLGMDVLQLLGVAYLVARVLYELPRGPRIFLAAALFAWHWAFLRFWPQGATPAGTFTEAHNAVGYAYAHWRMFHGVDLLGWLGAAWRGRLVMGWAGLLSVPPAAGMMLLGTLAGDLLRSEVEDRAKVRKLAMWGGVLAAIGLAWAFDLPFNKPRWTPCYLTWCAGVDFLVMAGLYWAVDLRRWRGWTYPLVVFGSNAIAAYFLSIMAKVLLLNTPRLVYSGERMSLGNALLLSLKHALGAWAGGWTFTILFIAFWWMVLDQMYRRRMFWKL